MVKVISQFEELNFSVRNMSIIIKLKLKDMAKNPKMDHLK